MTSHQDNAARLARIAQIGALVVILVAVGAFLIPMPAKDVSPGAGTNQPGGANPEQPPAEKFHVPEEDWSIALAPLGDARDPVVAVAGGPKGGPGGPGGDVTPPPPTQNFKDRPPIRYLGPLSDDQGMAALIDFAGQQKLLRIHQEFEQDYEITNISNDLIVVSDGFEEYTFELAQSTLTDAAPNPIINNLRNRGRTNPNAFPPGRTTPGQPEDTDTNPRRPETPQEDPKDGKGSPA
ncbi:MAG: hypothetical protein H6813_04690 [Phycisphaeraceae bacterium]|nr:hypothetical protein [Phycisphaeraceae bacterium]MCB9847247.1 hypothetical protein [Phycisphaeraceae bacterium]